MSMTAKQINLKSHALAKAAGKLNDNIHSHAMVIIKHIAEHGDVTVADVLCDALGANNMRVNALRQWFVTYGGCTWNAEKKKFRKAKEFNFDFEQANAEPFWLLQPEPEFKPVDGMALIKAAIAKMEKALADTEHQHNVSPELVAKLKAVIA